MSRNAPPKRKLSLGELRVTSQKTAAKETRVKVIMICCLFCFMHRYVNYVLWHCDSIISKGERTRFVLLMPLMLLCPHLFFRCVFVVLITSVNMLSKSLVEAEEITSLMSV